MVVVRLIGGLGNQLFQVATGLSVAERLKTILYFDARDYSGTNQDKYYSARKLEVDCLRLPSANILRTDFELRRIKKCSKVFLFRRKLHFIDEKEPSYNSDLAKVRGDLYLNGFWQSELYFKEIRSKILDSFVLSDPTILASLNGIVADIKSAPSVAVHVRRGDYVHDKKTAQAHGSCGAEYYFEAVEVLRKRLNKNLKIFLFTDDIAWCQQVLVPVWSNTLIVSKITESMVPFVDMYLMSICKAHVTSNSSFSWWGAWLNQENGNLVVCPSRWTLDKRFDHSDRIPKDWISMNPRFRELKA